MATRRKLMLFALTVLGLGALELRNPAVAQALPERCGVCNGSNSCPTVFVRAQDCIDYCNMSAFNSPGECEANDPLCGGNTGWWCGGGAES